MGWKIKYIKNAFKGIMPFQSKLRHIKSLIKPNLYEIDKWTLEQGLIQLNLLNENNYDLKNKTILEIGSGWMPIIPLIYYLAGANKIIMVDSQRLLDIKSFTHTVRNIHAYKELIASKTGLAINEIENMLKNDDQPKSLNDMLNKFRMIYMSPCDFTKDYFEPKSIDCICSRAVFEHIPIKQLYKISNVCHEILKDDGKVCHIIDNSDHWQHIDQSISRLNYLRFNNKLSSLISAFNPLDYQNRLRHYEYINLFKETGFKIEYDASKVDKNAYEELKQMKICDKYKEIPHDKLAILTSYLVICKSH
jgi:hypothetical protein